MHGNAINGVLQEKRYKKSSNYRWVITFGLSI